MNKENDSPKLLSLIQDSLDSSTIHAIPNIVRNKNILIKIVWSFFFLISACACFLMIIQSILAYFEYKVTTVIRQKNEFNAVFPTVSVCNLNMFTTDFALDYLKTISKQNNFVDIFNLSYKSQVTPNVQRQYSHFVVNYFLQNNLTLEEMKKFSYPMNDSIINCEFLFLNCKENSIQYFFNQLYGNCFRFNSGFDNNGQNVPVLNISRTFKEGLELTLFVGVPDSLKVMAPSLGVIVFVHNQSDSDYLRNYLLIPVNTQSDIKISRSFTKQMPKPYSNCELESNMQKYFLYQITKNYSNYYSQTTCVQFCFQKLCTQKCNCYTTGLGIYPGYKPCNLFEDSECLSKIYHEFISENYIKDNCLPECPLECDRFNMASTMTSIQLITNEYEEARYLSNEKVKKLFQKEKFNSSLRDNMVKINVYYETLAYTELEEFASLDLVTLMSNIGGVAGLFLGISVLSLVEIIEFLLKVFFTVIQKRNSETRIIPVKPKP